MLVTPDNFPQAIHSIAGRPRLAVDLETTGLSPWRNKNRSDIAGIATYNGTDTCYFPFSHSSTENLNSTQLRIILEIIAGTDRVDNHNIKFDMKFLLCAGMPCLPPVCDSMLGLYMMNENKPMGLKKRASEIFKDDSNDEEMALMRLLASWGYGKDEMWRMPAAMVAPYAEKDTVLAWKLCDYLEAGFDPTRKALWHQLNKLSNVVTKMEYRGIQVDRATLNANESEAQLASWMLKRRFQETYPGLNIASPQALARHFSLPDATEETLLMNKNKPGILDILNYRWWDKGVNTYYKQYKSEFMDDKDVIHTDFKITGTVAGRFSSREPNLQAIPRMSPEQKVKEVFVSRPGKKFAEIDYSQAEIRVGAHYTGEDDIINAIRSGVDLHQMVADEIGVSRDFAKTINFGIIYGMGAKKLSDKLNITLGEASKILAEYNRKYPGYRRTSKDVENLATTKGYVKMWNGRRRHFNERDSEPHTAFNAIIQGGVAQMVIATMVKLDEKLPEFEMVSQIHDAFLAEVDENSKDEIIQEAVSIMTDQPQFIVPMTVDVKTGTSYGRLEKSK